ncbi:MinD/ParA family protein [Bacillus shivajii]|uniref:MinD/ParA family protein n=1 Tax=Bacillus shivajii TaxID=1983719 RepID=UPI001CFC12EE|nr:MinD/ParA family protein [Bacillus shivajii]UCZ51708.1 MinD/ParA family protein [Bacillus shivajii]
MKDQAEALRSKLSLGENIHERKGQPETKVLGVVSGKGGVGKSNFVVNFALELQNRGKKVLIFDLDIGMANIDILLGQTSKFSIVDLLEEEMSIWEIIEKTPHHVSYIAGGSGLTNVFEMNQSYKNHFMDELQSIEDHFDYIIFDMGAGASKSSFQFLLAAHDIILLTTPEPTSITDGYAMIKHIYLEDSNLPISIVVNRVINGKEGKVTANNIIHVCKQFLSKEVKYIGAIPDDQAVLKAVRSQIPYIYESPNAKASQAMKKVVTEYIDDQFEDKQRHHHFLTKLKGLFK